MPNLDFSKQDLPFELPQRFLDFLCSKVVQDGLTTINLRDSDYSAENGGFRPVEISIEKKGNLAFLHYVTEFAYVGLGYCSELAKSCDFDFSIGVYTSSYTEFATHIPSEPLSKMADFFTLNSDNFVSYVEMELLDTVQVTTSKEHLAL